MLLIGMFCGLSTARASLQSGPATDPATLHRYALLQPATWSAAQTEGALMGGNLATINDLAEEEWVDANLGRPGNVWIGLNDATTEGAYVWAGGGVSAYRNWAVGQPAAAGDWALRQAVDGLWKMSGNTAVTDGNDNFALVEITPTVIAQASTTTGTLTPGQWKYFRVNIPAASPGWRMVLSSTGTGDPDLFVQRADFPTESAALQSSTGAVPDTIVFTDTDATEAAYIVGIHLAGTAAGNSSFTLKSELGFFRTLTWDPGTSDVGTSLTAQPDTLGGLYYHRITAQASTVGGWRTRLRVTSGTADLYMSQNELPFAGPNGGQYSGENPGTTAEGWVLHPSLWSESQDWYILVKASPGSQWDLVTGEPFVQDLGTLSTSTTPFTGTIGGEKMRFFKTSVPANTPAWRLRWTNGMTSDILVRRGQLAFASGNWPYNNPDGYRDFQVPSKLLLVPPYLGEATETFFIGVAGGAGTAVSLQSMVQPITNIAFDSTTSVDLTSTGFATYRVQVPVEQIAWEVQTTPTTGDPAVCVRRDIIPSDWQNDAYSQVSGTTVQDSIVLSPPTLTDGTFFITVYGTGTCSLRSRNPIITTVPYLGTVTNDAPTKAGWRYYEVTDMDAQLGTLGWDLVLGGAAVTGTEIALRLGGVPSRWNSRTAGAELASTGHVDYSSTLGFLQRPGHQAGVWYVGIYQPQQPLGAFTLTRSALTGPLVAFNNSTTSRTNVPGGRWEFFRVDVPTGVLGWDVRLTNVTAGQPEMVICRDGLPDSVVTTWSSLPGFTWPTRYKWAASTDWTGYSNDPGSIPVSGRTLAMGMGNPLEPGTYYVGVMPQGGMPASYSLQSRGIGTGLALPVTSVAFAGGSQAISALPAREAKYFSVDIPANQRSWHLRVGQATGEMLLVVQEGIPNVLASENGTGPYGKKMQRTGPDHYTLFPPDGQDFITAGRYYVAVVSEGVAPSGAEVGTGTASGTLQSLGELPAPSLGTASVATALATTVTAEGGEYLTFRFTVPAGLPSVEISTDGPEFRVVAGSRWPGFSPNSYNYYGTDGGVYASSYGSGSTPLTIANPTAGTYSITVQVGAGFEPADTTFTLRVAGKTPQTVAFNGGTAAVTAHAPATWRYFRVDVPSGALGWTLRLINRVGGNPSYGVRRDLLPTGLGATTDLGGGWYDFWSGAPWPSGYTRGAGWSWAGLTSPDGAMPNASGMELGRSTEPGTYYIGVFNNSATEAAAYTVQSRGVGAGLALGVTALAFTSGTANITNLAPGEVSFFSVDVPANTRGWKLRLENLAGETSLRVKKGFIPDTDSNYYYTYYYTSPFDNSPGQWLRQSGAEHDLVLSADETGFVPAGRYYLAVASEGANASVANELGPNPASARLVSIGELPSDNIGIVAANSTAFRDAALAPGESHGYRFTLPAGLTNVRVEIEDETAPVTAYLKEGQAWGTYLYSNQPYGLTGGVHTPLLGTLLNQASPPAGTYSVLVHAGQAAASYRLRITTQGLTVVAFDGGTKTETAQPSGTWRYFQVTVPPTASGWDVRLVNVSGGSPQMTIARDVVPPGGTGLATYATEWPSGAQLSASTDWTGYSYDPNGTYVPGQVFGAGMGRPLSAGTYIIGVNNYGQDDANYTMRSRGIGTGLSYPITPLTFNGGTAAISGLPGREMKFFSVTVPANTPSWRFRVTPTSGDFVASVLYGALPNTSAYFPASAIDQKEGYRLTKSGTQFYSLMAPSGQESIPAGIYYIAVASRGEGSSGNTLGTGSAAGSVTSLGSLPVTALGTASVSTDLTRTDSALGSETKRYSFTLPAGLASVQLTLEDSVGSPLMSIGTGIGQPRPWYDTAGIDGGTYTYETHATLLTLTNPAAGTHTVTVWAGTDAGGNFADVTYRLRVKVKSFLPLSFDSLLNAGGVTHSDTRTVQNAERTFYAVTVPATLGGQAVLGWRLKVETQSGSANIRAHKDFTQLTNGTAGVIFSSGQAIIAPPYLTPGTWYVEVQGSGATIYTLTSEAVRLQVPAYTLAATLNTESGNSGEVDLEEDGWHFYAITVPEGNLGVLRTVLEAVSGNPDLYVRVGNIPTTSHVAMPTLNNTNAYDRSLTGTATEYGNWVPLGRFDRQLTPGRWYLGVRASGGSNCRYRLRLHTGVMQDLALSGGSAANLSIPAGDWRYYRVTLPLNAPQQWLTTYSQSLGDVTMWIRETTPPGDAEINYGAAAWIRDWAYDAKNQGPYLNFPEAGTHTLTTPPLRPGSTYFLGFRASADATISVSSATAGGTIGTLPVLNFYGGSVTNISLPAYGSLTYRIPVPNDARRWIHHATHGSDIQISLDHGTLPDLTQNSPYRSTLGENNTGYDNSLLYGWPWLPGYDYYLTVKNSVATTRSFSLVIDGRNAATDDSDLDGLPDAWEEALYGYLGYGYGGDMYGGNGVTNLVHYALGSSPANVLSGRPVSLNQTLTGPANQQRLQLTFNVPQILLPNVRVIVETQSTLDGSWLPIATRTGSGPWSGPGITTTGAANPDGTIPITVTEPTSAERRFGRVTVERLP